MESTGVGRRGGPGEGCRQPQPAEKAWAAGTWDMGRRKAASLLIMGITRGHVSFPEPEEGLYLHRALVSVAHAPKGSPSSCSCSTFCHPFQQHPLSSLPSPWCEELFSRRNYCPLPKCVLL